MATLNEISYSILSQVYNFNISDDIDVDLDWVYYQIDTVKNSILKKEIENPTYNFDIYKYYNKINCIKLECVDKAECCEINTDCFIQKISLPTTLLYPHHTIVANPLFNKKFEYVPLPLLDSVIYRRIKVGIGYWYYIKNNIYLLPNIEGLEYVSIMGLFENTSKLKEINKCDGSPCYSPDEEYPIEVHHIPYVEQYVTNLIRMALNNVKDLTNNALDDAINTIRGDMNTLNNQLNSIDVRQKE